MEVFLWTIGATIAVSLVAFVGIFSLSMKDAFLNKILFALVGFAAGSLMGGAFLHLIPEAAEVNNSLSLFVFILVGFALFFLIERLLKWRHCHEGHCHVHTFTKMSLIGDGVHNFIDGLIIAASFMTDIHLGIITTIAVIIHEFPQEMGDFAILVYGGYSKGKALLFNFFTALLAVLGGVIGLLLLQNVEGVSNFLIPFAAGGFIYIAASDLIPELHKEQQTKKAFSAFAFFILGLIVMYILKLLFANQI